MIPIPVRKSLPLGADNAAQQAHRRRRARDPIEPVNDAEYRQGLKRHVEGEGQIEQRQAAQSVIRNSRSRLSQRSLSQPAIVPPTTAKTPVTASRPAPATSLNP
jgi:hypothetical protein